MSGSLRDELGDEELDSEFELESLLELYESLTTNDFDSSSSSRLLHGSSWFFIDSFNKIRGNSAENI